MKFRYSATILSAALAVAAMPMPVGAQVIKGHFNGPWQCRTVNQAGLKASVVMLTAQNDTIPNAQESIFRADTEDECSYVGAGLVTVVGLGTDWQSAAGSAMPVVELQMDLIEDQPIDCPATLYPHLLFIGGTLDGVGACSIADSYDIYQGYSQHHSYHQKPE